jgi:glycosyltransferase involved in cell wall biosynthesis
MRIAFITPGYSSAGDKWAIPALRNLVDALGENYDIEVVSLRYPFQSGRYRLNQAGVTALGGGQAAGLRRLPLLWRGWQALLAAHRNQPFDLVHGFWADEPGFLTVQASARLGIPGVVSLMGGELVQYPELNYGGQLSWFNRRFINQALEKADLVTAGSHQLLDLARNHNNEAKLAFFPLGVDTRQFRPLPAGPKSNAFGAGNRMNILIVGSLVPIKDHTTIFQAVRKIDQAGKAFNLHLVGKGPLRETLEASVLALDLADSVILHGYVSHQQLAAYYQAADIYLQSSRFESQGMAVLEAAACGLALAGTATGILPEIVPEAWTAPLNDPLALAEVLAHLLRNPATRVARAREITSHVHANFGIDQTVNKLLEQYQLLMGR